MSDISPALLWTVAPIELVLDGMETDLPVPVEVTVGGRLLQVVPGMDGTGTIQRLLSSNPYDYLDPRWQPGVTVQLPAGTRVPPRSSDRARASRWFGSG